MEYRTWPELQAAIARGEYEAFHGTTIDNLESIQQLGLIGLLGNFVQEAYDEEIEMLMDYHRANSIEELEHALGDRLVVYFGTPDEEGLHRTKNAILTQVGKKLGKTMWEVSAEDVAAHGLMVALKSAEGLFLMGEDDRVYELELKGDEVFESEVVEPNDLFLNKYSLIPRQDIERPLGAEPEDLFSPEAGMPDAWIVGDALVALIKSFSLIWKWWDRQENNS